MRTIPYTVPDKPIVLTMPIDWGMIIAGVSALFAGIATLAAIRALRETGRAETEIDGQWKERVEALSSRIVKEISELRHIVLSSPGRPRVASSNPLRLTAIGKIISKEIAAPAWVDRVSDTLLDQVQGKDAYEVQNFCLEYVESADLDSAAEQRAIHNAAGQPELGANDIRRVLAIELRDKLLREAGLEAPEGSHESSPNQGS